jgi:hypothetical protein
VWSADTSRALSAAGRSELATQLDRDAGAWRSGRDAACSAPVEQRAARLACLDGVLARFAAVRSAIEHVPGALAPDDVVPALVDPAVCAGANPPRLVATANADVASAFASLADSRRPDTKLTDAEADALARKPGLDPCARAIALLAVVEVTKDVPKGRAAANDAVEAAEQCGDERLRADALVALAPLMIEQPIVGPRGEEAVRRAAIAVARVAQPDLLAHLDMLRATIAIDQEHYDDALALVARAAEEFGERGERRNQLRTAIEANTIRRMRLEPGDLETVRATVATWKPIAVQLRAKRAEIALSYQDAYARYFMGDVAGGHAEIVRLWHPEPNPDAKTRAIEGTVVDAAGKPVAGATVAAAATLFCDSIGIPFPFGEASITSSLRSVTTDANGHFAIADAPQKGAIMAQLGDRRSEPTTIDDHLKLALTPTRRVAGRVAVPVASTARTLVFVEPTELKTDAFRLVSPVARDGTFVLDGAPVSALQIGAAVQTGIAARVNYQQLPASKASSTNLVLEVATTERTLDVIARSTVYAPLDTAQVLVFDGKVTVRDVGDLLDRVQRGGLHASFAKPVVGERAPKTVIGKLRPGDLVAHFANISAGDLTVCAVGLNGDLSDPKVDQKIQAHIRDLQIKCEPVGPNDRAVVVEAPPQKRFD